MSEWKSEIDRMSKREKEREFVIHHSSFVIHFSSFLIRLSLFTNAFLFLFFSCFYCQSDSAFIHVVNYFISFCWHLHLDHLQIINLIIEKSVEYNFKISIEFIDYNKAFDSSHHNFLLAALKCQGVLEQLSSIVKNMYLNPQSRIITNKTGPYFHTKKGARQGDPLSPYSSTPLWKNPSDI